ncbi:hypothetical protein F511_12365 [Dorcoceras hygrometricum]|uniref:Uncharacterized protein n=1 Tax=Dorcoceras hygrometricum TaxID=472368 RepID=A0A2Z7DF62_9LAMI|nr:hypothetical protein F511_12365 [Dorcoceras hygrometricum]
MPYIFLVFLKETNPPDGSNPNLGDIIYRQKTGSLDCRAESRRRVEERTAAVKWARWQAGPVHFIPPAWRLITAAYVDAERVTAHPPNIRRAIALQKKQVLCHAAGLASTAATLLSPEKQHRLHSKVTASSVAVFETFSTFFNIACNRT